MDALNTQWIWLIALAPLIGSIIVAFFGKKTLKENSAYPIILGVGTSMVMSWWVLKTVLAAVSESHGGHGVVPVIIEGFQWINVGGLQASIQASIDPLAAVMLATVTTVSFFVMIYSKGYMKDDPSFWRFFAYLGMFVFSMVVLILADNFALIFFGWEAVGVCSYLLIGYYFQKPSAAAANKKAFILNRIGDFGFIMAILLIIANFGTVNFAEVFERYAEWAALAENTTTKHLIALCLFMGACGKSAQLPLYLWLPDAMEGPSPVSALIHAATMVTAGVYMTVRCGVIFTSSDVAMHVVAIVGACTALFAATMGMAQTDVKRIWAYSTVSQLGYMFIAVGVGDAVFGIFHLYTHAFFKALLFLSAGSVMHAMHHHIDLKDIGGLRKDLPITTWTCCIGGLALAGFPFLAGYWSKDGILASALNHPTLQWVGWIGVLTAVMTAFYTFRCFFLTFFGPRKVPADAHHIHESKWMMVPLLALAVGAMFAGWAVGTSDGDHGNKIGNFLNESSSIQAYTEYTKDLHHGHEHAYSHSAVAIGSSVLAVIGIVIAFVVYRNGHGTGAKLAKMLGPIYRGAFNKWYIDEIFVCILVKPLYKLGRICFGSDNYVINFIIWLVCAVPRSIGFLLSILSQTGGMQSYAMQILLGVTVIIFLVLTKTASLLVVGILAIGIIVAVVLDRITN